MAVTFGRTRLAMAAFRTYKQQQPSLGLFSLYKPAGSLRSSQAIAGSCRHYASQDRGGNHIVIRDYGVFANYIPPDTLPPMSDFKNWRLAKWRNLRNTVQNMLSVGLIKYKSQHDKWHTAQFLGTATETYKEMNEAFSRGDRNLLEHICLDSMYSNLKNQVKQRGSARWEWKYHGDVEAPQIICVRCMSSTGVSKHGFAVAQVTARMFTKQSMAVYDKKNRLVGGNPDIIHNVLEYVVFQKTISNPHDVWRVYGKIAPKTA